MLKSIPAFPEVGNGPYSRETIVRQIDDIARRAKPTEVPVSGGRFEAGSRRCRRFHEVASQAVPGILPVLYDGTHPLHEPFDLPEATF